MSGTTYQAFEDFMESITITDYQKTSIVAGRTSGVNADLKEAFPSTSDLPFIEAKLMGSAAKGTIVRPIDDVDVLAIFSNENKAWQNSYQYDSQAFIYRIRKAYDGFHAVQVGTRGQAIRVFYQNGGHVDVAPVFIQADGVYHLPSGAEGWILTAPFKANEWFLKKHAELGYNLATLVRLLKKWNQAHSKRLKSFHLETMAAHSFSSLSSNRRTGLQKFFEWSGSYLDVSDPGGQSGSLSGYLTWSGKDEVRKSLAQASDRSLKALAAEEQGDNDEAKRQWRIILGSSFPA